MAEDESLGQANPLDIGFHAQPIAFDNKNIYPGGNQPNYRYYDHGGAAEL